jgi:hypothetical protein
MRISRFPCDAQGDGERSGCLKLPSRRKFPEWHSPPLAINRIGIILMICNHWLNRANPDHHWRGRAEAVFREFRDIELHHMGLPADWLQQPLWLDLLNNRPSLLCHEMKTIAPTVFHQRFARPCIEAAIDSLGPNPYSLFSYT